MKGEAVFKHRGVETHYVPPTPQIQSKRMLPKERRFPSLPPLILMRPLPSSLPPSLSEQWGENGAW